MHHWGCSKRGRFEAIEAMALHMAVHLAAGVCRRVQGWLSDTLRSRLCVHTSLLAAHGSSMCVPTPRGTWRGGGTAIPSNPPLFPGSPEWILSSTSYIN